MRIIFLGSGAFGCETLESLVKSGHEIPLVVTQPARPAGRGRKIIQTPIAKLSNNLGLNCQETDNINTPDYINMIHNFKPEIILVIAFGQKIGPEILSTPNCKTINLHSSLLPKYRGAAPINWAILNGDKVTGITVIELNEIWDAGAIWGKYESEILPNETAHELHDRLSSFGPELIKKVLQRIQSGDLPEKQNDEQATRAPKLKKSDGAINWSLPAEEVHRHILGMWSWPGAYCYIMHGNKKKRLMISRAEIVDMSEIISDQTPIQPGSFYPNMSVACKDGAIKLLEVKPDNGKLMNFEDLMNGWHLTQDNSFLDG